ncbi:MAG: hypothetical protein IKN26_06820 [Eubacterium sp.]|nr:hypothetical protein [Eubacterium sp.]
MVSEMLSEVLKKESEIAVNEQNARKKAEEIISEAKTKAKEIVENAQLKASKEYEAAAKSANNEAGDMLADAQKEAQLTAQRLKEESEQKLSEVTAAVKQIILK